MKREKIIIKTSIQGIFVNVILVIFKATVGFVVNSIAIILDALNNLSDALSSIITIIGAKLASKSPDKKHPYGHGRIEYFASVIISFIVLIAGLTAFKESIEKIINPVHANYTIVSLFIIIVAVIVKFFFGRYVKNIGNKIDSGSLIASGTDAIFDSALSFSTFIAAIISMLWNISLEGILGLIISVIIIKSSIDLLKETLNTIIGIRIDSDLAKNIKKQINTFDEVKGAYDLVLHNYGPTRIMGSVHIEVADTMSAKEIHKLTREIRYKVYSKFGIILTVGIYATNIDSKESKAIHHTLLSLIKKYEDIIQMHGFYVDEEEKIISFDLIFEFESKRKDDICTEIIKELKEKYPTYEYYPIIDTDFSE